MANKKELVKKIIIDLQKAIENDLDESSFMYNIGSVISKSISDDSSIIYTDIGDFIEGFDDTLDSRFGLQITV
jgi:hypothetical protein